MATHKLLELTAADVMRQDGLTLDDLAPLGGCPYAEKGHAATGDGWLCVLAEGACPFQSSRPTTGGRHVCACLRPPVLHEPRPLPARNLPFETVSPRARLAELVRRLVATGRLFVIDDQGGVIGTVSGDDLVDALAENERRRERIALLSECHAS